MRLRSSALVLFALLILALSQPADATPNTDRTIELIELSGPIDGRMVEFAIDSIERAAAAGTVEVLIVQLDSPAVTAEAADFERLFDLVQDPPLPLVAWLGPSSAEVGGGSAQLLAAAPLRTASPGARIGHWAPTIAGEQDSRGLIEAPTAAVLGDPIVVDAPVQGIVDLVSEQTASPRQLVQLLDGQDVGGVTLSTLRPFADENEEGITHLDIVLREPGLWDRTMRLGATPDVAFFLLIAGLTIAAFEFYAIGPGIAAVVAAGTLLLAGAGLGSTGYRWWAMGLACTAVWLLAVSYQRGGVVALSGLGFVILAIAGFSFTDTGDQIGTSVPGVLLTVAGAAFFFLLAMPTVARSRFSTQTIGRDALLGTAGVAVDDLDPDGMVEVNGARWRATSHRQAGIRPGDPIRVMGVDGWTLDVAPEPVPE